MQTGSKRCGVSQLTADNTPITTKSDTFEGSACIFKSELFNKRRGFAMGLMDDAKKAAKDAGDKVSEAAADLKDAVSEKFADAKKTGSEKADEVKDIASDKGDELKANAKVAQAEAEKKGVEFKNDAKDAAR
ncbi:MAG: hypothetical protein ABF747_08145 [Bifidobacterium sp.]|uniref:Uncharacterized protein n=2 Tax=Bifidobacterium fermentum TaxID=3059035 RepID=A0AB39UL64_9BIFI